MTPGATGRLRRLGDHAWRAVRRSVAPIACVIALVVLWHVATVSGWIESYLLPQPGEVAQVMNERFDVLVRHAWATLAVALAGLALGTLLAVISALAFTLSTLLRRGLYPMVLALRSLPFIGVMPILVVSLGQGEAPKIAVCALGAYVTVIVPVMHGLRSAGAETVELMESLHASPWQMVTKVQLFAMLPGFWTGVRIAASSTVMIATVGEWLVGSQGLGYLVKIAGFNFQLPLMWAAVIIATALTLLLVAIVDLVAAASMPWSPPGADRRGAVRSNPRRRRRGARTAVAR